MKELSLIMLIFGIAVLIYLAIDFALIAERKCRKENRNDNGNYICGICDCYSNRMEYTAHI